MKMLDPSILIINL